MGAPDRGESELDASVDKLFDKSGSGTQTEQGDSADSEGGQGINIQSFTETIDTIAKDVILLWPRRQKKRKTSAAEVGGSSHPPKKLREDHETLSGPPIAGKSRSALQRLLARAVLNAEVKGDPIPTLPFVTSSVSAMPEHEAGIILTLSSVSVMTTVTTTTPTADLVVIVKEKTVKPFMFASDSSSAGGADPDAGVSSDLSGSDFIVSGIRTVIIPDTDLQKVYMPQWSVSNGSRLDNGRVYREMVDEFVRPKFFELIRGMKHDQLFTEYNGEKNQLLKAREEEIKNLKAQMLLKEAEAAKAIRLRAEASNFKAMEKSLWDEVNALNGYNTILEKEHHALDVKVTDLEAAVVSKERELTKMPSLLPSSLKMTTSLIRWILTYGMKLAIVKCLDSPEYVSALGIAISKAIQKGMQVRLVVRITHGKEGQVLTDVAAYKPSTEIDYVFALQQLQSVNFPLLEELKSN
nr:hypothetical protein [Tanacetum cinerariifolium]